MKVQDHPAETAENLQTNVAKGPHPFDLAQIQSLSKSKVELLIQSRLPSYFPDVLYAKGNENLLELPKVAIVGSRQPTLYGRQLVSLYASEIAKAGVCVVSGGALGIDFIASKNAFEHGSTIIVVGGGLGCPHPASHRSFVSMVGKRNNGLVLSQFQPLEAAAPWHFPKRNVTLALLSDFVLIIEAGEKSGSLITARAALEHGIDLGALPGDVFSPLSKGTNDLIADGAFCIRSPQEVIERVMSLRKIRKMRSMVE